MPSNPFNMPVAYTRLSAKQALEECQGPARLLRRKNITVDRIVDRIEGPLWVRIG
jgi:hypothetical protein